MMNKYMLVNKLPNKLNMSVEVDLCDPVPVVVVLEVLEVNAAIDCNATQCAV